ncbi:hypothetical protein METBIDRAFT_195848 [Metschnikowia bicuspidata var. bicuspidata NRRL YB-4993]|uniref:Uncharacterized protein n=1 Tax=Metschnikowia bicuspidata var. bicuspidata NRRL YB-4993 TaxID=869754 RepID=A0A1A0H866_9ASCO|nr:hypothetical protein METBIDRAFT_195848 [Metschnikowia bicuspidata var. bicuspidata NRRL YB-4993]OBA20299.1 hypothetical protein METBIDRAFT_195848 [Metschnikowia bicuspidata var. bicuspidata NRRL YB-4993]
MAVAEKPAQPREKRPPVPGSAWIWLVCFGTPCLPFQLEQIENGGTVVAREFANTASAEPEPQLLWKSWIRFGWLMRPGCNFQAFDAGSAPDPVVGVLDIRAKFWGGLLDAVHSTTLDEPGPVAQIWRLVHLFWAARYNKWSACLHHVIESFKS